MRGDLVLAHCAYQNVWPGHITIRVVFKPLLACVVALQANAR